VLVWWERHRVEEHLRDRGLDEAQVVEQPPSKCEALNSNPTLQKKKRKEN
jgi:hypothetical protein